MTNYMLIHISESGTQRLRGWFETVGAALQHIYADSDRNQRHWELHRVDQTIRFTADELEHETVAV